MTINDIKIISTKPLNRTAENKAADDLSDKDDQKLRDASKQLEGQFLTFMLKAMEKTIQKSDDNDKSNLASMMFSSVIADDVAKNGGIGLADYIYKALKENGSEALKNMPLNISGNPLPNIKLTGFEDE